jgi:ABC-2 type transport system ATP-binding protein
MGLDIPNSGSALVNGQPYRDLAWPLREVGAMLDARAFHPGRSAYDHLLYLANMNEVPRWRIDHVLDIVGLTEVARQRAGKFSLGMGQRLGIAGALLGDPGVLLFDEPVNGLDPEGIRWVRHLLRDLAAQGRTVFVSSHLINEMSVTADQLVVIGRGALIAQTSVQEFTARSASDSVRVVASDLPHLIVGIRRAGGTVAIDDDHSLLVSGMTSAEIGQVASKEGITLHELTPIRASLEDAFMTLTQEAVQFRSLSESERATELATIGSHGMESR